MKLLADLSSEQVRLQNHLREKAGLPPVPDQDAELYCRKCNTWKPDEEFYACEEERNRPSRRGRKYDCKACSNAYRARRREETKTPCPDCSALKLAESKRCVPCAVTKYKLPFSWMKPRACVDCGGPARGSRCLECFRLTRPARVC